MFAYRPIAIWSYKLRNKGFLDPMQRTFPLNIAIVWLQSCVLCVRSLLNFCAVLVEFIPNFMTPVQFGKTTVYYLSIMYSILCVCTHYCDLANNIGHVILKILIYINF